MQVKALQNIERNSFRKKVQGILNRYSAIELSRDHYSITTGNCLRMVNKVREFISEICNIYSIHFGDIEDIVIASDEAMTNIIMHGLADSQKKCDEGSQITFRIKIFPEEKVLVELLDRGVEFHVGIVDKPNVMDNLNGDRVGGFGLYIIYSVMDSVHYKRISGVNVFQAYKILRYNSITSSRG